MGSELKNKITTEQEFLEWGLKENEIRLTDLSGLPNKEQLDKLQQGAKKRRSEVGLTATQATIAVTMAQKHILKQKRMS